MNSVRTCCRVVGLFNFGLLVLMPGQWAMGEVVSPKSLEEARLQAKLVTQVRPDRRFVRAAEFIVQKLADTPTSASVELMPQDGQWLVTVGSDQLGTISPLPKFDEAYAFLEDVARKYIKDRPNKAAERYNSADLSRQLDLFLLDDILTATRTIDSAWNDRSSSLPLSLARKAALYLHIQTYDVIGFRDELSGRALAFMAAESALTSAPIGPDRVLLESLLGYHDEAKIAAASLPGDNPAVLYVLDKSNELIELGQKDIATTATWFLAMRNLLKPTVADSEGITALLRKRKEIKFEDYLLPLGPVLFSTQDWESKARLALQVASLLAMDVSGRNPDSIGQNEQIVPVFMQGISKLEEPSHGPLMDQELRAILCENAFCNCLNATMRFFLYQFGDADGARTILKTIGTTSEGMTGEYLDVVDATLNESGEGPSKNRLIQLLNNLKYVNSSISNMFYGKISSNTDTHQGDPIVAGTAQLKRLDSRPENYDRLEAMFTEDGFRDLEAVEPVYVAKATPAITENLFEQARLAYFLGDSKKLMEIYHNPDLRPFLRAKYLDFYLVDDTSMTTETKDKMIWDLVDENPADYYVKFYAVAYFKKRDRLDEAIKVATKYAQTQATAGGLKYPNAITSLAELHALNRDYKKALELVTPVAEAYTASALTGMAQYNIALGNYKVGQEWIDKANKRYENNSESFALEVYSNWLQGKYTEAADVVKKYKKPLTSSILRRQLGEYFFLALGDKPSEEREKAIVELKRIGLGEKLGDMGFHFRRKDRFDMVFEFNKHLEEEGTKRFRGPVVAYNALRLHKDENAALQWLKTRITPDEYPLLGGIAFRESEFTILDSLVPYDDSTTIGRYNWTLRAAAVCDKPAAEALMGKQVREYFSQKKHDDFHYTAGRYLLDLAEKAELLAKASTLEEIAQGACYLGIKARAAGNYREANEWFQAVFRTGLTELDEYSKARIITANWNAVRRSLDIMPEIMKSHKIQTLPGM